MSSKCVTGSGITVGTFNTLQRSFERRRYASHVPDNIKSWKNRKLLLASLLPTLGDVIAAQECEIGTFEEDYEFMKSHGYDAIAPFDKSARKDKSKLSLAKTAMFYKTSKFDLIWHDHRSRTLLSAMVEKSTQRILWMVNCHLEGHPEKVGERFSQIKSALNLVAAKQRKMKYDPEDCHLVVCGDFNCSKECVPISFILNGGVTPADSDPWNPEEIITTTPVSHPYKMTNITPEGFTFLGSTGNPQSIDYVFISHNIGVERVKGPSTQSQWDEAVETGLPNEKHPSDHFPLLAELHLL